VGAAQAVIIGRAGGDDQVVAVKLPVDVLKRVPLRVWMME
jgi:hypothetical protein